LAQGKDFAWPISMVWQMSGGPACAEAARRKSVAKMPRENLSERKLKSFMIVVISFRVTSRFDGQDAKEETGVNNGGKK
jgi:hypothetical protein